MALADSLARVASNVLKQFGLEDVNLREVNELVQAGDKRLTVAADDLATAPETKDRVVISSVVHQIIRVETTEQDGTAIIHELILRA